MASKWCIDGVFSDMRIKKWDMFSPESDLWLIIYSVPLTAAQSSDTFPSDNLKEDVVCDGLCALIGQKFRVSQSKSKYSLHSNAKGKPNKF